MYLRPFLRLVVSGQLYLTESFSWGFALIDNGEGPQGPPETINSTIISAIQAYHTSVGGPAASARLQTIKMNQIGTDGRYLQQETVRHDYVPDVPGTGSGFPAPQVALAISLDTALRRGRAARGRFYMPVPTSAIDSAGRISSGAAQAHAAAATTMLNAVAGSLVGWRVGVVSDIGVGAQEPVTNVRVGRVLDTIRSRRRSIPEEYWEGVPLDAPAPAP